MNNVLKCALFLMLFMEMPLWADSMDYENELTNISLDKGYVNLIASDFCMDADGQMWMTTSQGLFVYNGQNFTSFKLPEVSPRDLSCSHVDINRHGDVYVAGHGGLFVLPFGQDQMKRVIDHMVLSVKITEDQVFYGDKEGLHSLDEKGNSKLLYRCTLEDISVRCIRIEGDKVWFTACRRLGCYDMKTKKVSLHHVLSTSSLTDFSVFKGKIYLGTKSDGLQVFDILNKRQKKVTAGMINSVKVCGNDVLVATDGLGAYVLDGNTAKVKEHYSVLGTGRYHLPDNTIYCFLRDKQGANWFGVFSFGILHSSYSQPIFSVFSENGFTSKDKSIRCFLQDKNVFLLGTRSGLYWKKAGMKTPSLVTCPDYETAIITDLVKFGGKYYVSTYDKGLLVLDLATGVLKHAEGNAFFKNSSFYCMRKAPDGSLWITGSEGVFVIKPTGQVKLVLIQDKKTRRIPMHGIEFDSQGRVWVGTNLGVILIDSRTYRIQNFKGDMKAFSNITSCKVAKGHHDQMLVYSDDSLKIYNVKSLQHQDLALPEMIVGDRCNVIYDDQKGHYYIANEKDLFRTDYDFDNVLSLGSLQNLNVSYISSNGILDKDGELWICSGNGLYHTKIENLEKNIVNKAHFPIIPYRLSLGGSLTGIGAERKVLHDKKIYTTWNFVQLRVSFTPVFGDFARQEGRIYEYHIDNGEWTVCKDQYVDIHGLLPGKHSLAVRLLGIPSSETVYSVWVTPSVLFWIEMFLLVVVVLSGFRFKSYRKKTKTLLNERNIIEQALIEVEEVQNKVEEKLFETPSESKKAVKINHAEMEQLFRRVDELMQTNKPYLNAGMRLSDLSAALGVSNTVLSNMFKYYVEESYYDYVNRYRLKEFKRYLEEKAYKQYTIMALSEKCGFKKSSFFTTFRKMEGMTPTEYLQKHT
jgi:ligand-binding sensor domain-containing protein/AraC-like DNA-binding protein